MPLEFEELESPRARKRTSKESHRTRDERTARNDLEFIAVDGEGMKFQDCRYEEQFIDDTWTDIAIPVLGHKYVLLSVGQESLHRNGERLTHREIFPFLLEQFTAHPRAVFVGYFLGYDFTHWLRSIDDRSAWLLLTPQGKEYRRYWDQTAEVFRFRSVIIDEKWEIDALWPKQFQIRRHYHSEFGHIVRGEDGKNVRVHCTQPEPVPTRMVKGEEVPDREARSWMYINDVGSFFQTSFLKAIDPAGWSGVKLVTEEEYKKLAAGKLRRDSAVLDEEMIEYNLKENQVLQDLMGTLNAGFVHDNIRLGRRDYYGPGQAADKWLKNINAPRGKEVRSCIPLAAREAARASYYGGWFEIFVHGIVKGNSYGYDINSAYPDVIRSLPCLLHGKWKHGKGKPRRAQKLGVLRLSRVRFSGSNGYAGGMPIRTKDGRVLRPRNGIGWYWQDELDASVLAGLIDELKYFEYWDYEPCPCPPPLREIEELYKGRLEKIDGVSIKNSPRGKAKKLVYNSTYGKCCQSIGNPTWANVVYASRITSGCRKKILHAIATHPKQAEDLLMVATDGIYFASQHPELDRKLSDNLGDWDKETHPNLALFLPGMYWDDRDRAAIAANKRPKLKSRGVASTDLQKYVTEIDEQWKKGILYPSVKIGLEFCMTGAKLAIARRAWETCGQELEGQLKVIDSMSNSSKRLLPEIDPVLIENGIDRNHPWIPFRGAYRSVSASEGPDGLETFPYLKSFGDDECEYDDSLAILSEAEYLKMLEEDESEFFTPDGTLKDVLPVMVKEELMERF